jgi:hypothetical protein
MRIRRCPPATSPRAGRRPRPAGHPPLLAGVLAAAVALAIAACAADQPLDDETRDRVQAQGDAAVTALMQTLAGRLTAAMAEGGPAHAIDFCAGEAMALTDSVAATLGPGWELKRTTLLARNPANGPDALELEALERFHAAEVAGDEPRAHFVQRTPAGDYRYYRPLRIAALCLGCHGAPDDLDPAVREMLAARYPDDRAVGYETDDLRGLVRVTVPASAVGP